MDNLNTRHLLVFLVCLFGGILCPPARAQLVVMPRSIDSQAAVVEFVAHTHGAIGYIARSTPHEGVKVLPVR